MNWVWAFNKSCNINHVKKAAPVIRDISVLSQKLYEEIKTSENFTAQYEKKGLLMLCQTEKLLEEELKMAELAVELGLEAKEIGPNELKELEPNVEINILWPVIWSSGPPTKRERASSLERLLH